MKIAVCVKHVPAGKLRLDESTLRLDRSGDTQLNPRDLAAVEASLRLRDSVTVDEIVLLTLGPDEAVRSVREGIAMGADRGVVCSDPRAEGSDFLATSHALAQLLRREEPALTLFGQVASDSEGATVWAAVGRRLGWPALSQAVELRIAEGLVQIRRQTEAGHETLSAGLPCLVSVTEAFEPRFPSFREMKAAADRPVDVIDLDEAGIDLEVVGAAGSRTEVLGVSPAPASGRNPLLVEDDDAAHAVLTFLVEHGLA